MHGSANECGEANMAYCLSSVQYNTIHENFEKFVMQVRYTTDKMKFIEINDAVLYNENLIAVQVVEKSINFFQQQCQWQRSDNHCSFHLFNGHVKFFERILLFSGKI